MADLLVVDDDLDLAEILGEVLSSHGHTVRIAKNGELGLRKLGERLPDLVLLDIEMPVLSGPGMALRMFMEDLGKERIPIIIISGSADIRKITALIGTHYSLEKPFSLDAVQKLIELAMRERRLPHPTFSPAKPSGPT